ncbi:MAG: MXAN_5187 family protein [Myxococcota bacterium]
MARIKFLLFALVVFGAWLWHLWALSPLVSTRAQELAAASAASASAVMALELDQHRFDLQTGLLAAVGNPAVLAAAKPGYKGEAPSPEKFATVRQELVQAMPEALRASAVIGWINEGGAIYARAEAEPVVAKEGGEFDPSSLASVSAGGTLQDAFGVPHVFFALPLAVADKPDQAKVHGHLVVGVPVLPPGVAEAVAKELKLGAVAVLAGGKIVESSSALQASAAALEQSTQPGQTKVIERGQVDRLGPLQLPALTERDPLGGSAALSVGSRQELRGTPFEVVAIADLRPWMTTLASYQRLAMFVFAGLFGLTLVWTLVMGSGAVKRAAAKDKEEKKESAASAPPPTPARSEAPPALPISEIEPVAEASPDDFQFGPPPETPGPDAFSGAVAEPPPVPFDDGALPAEHAFSPFNQDEARTVATMPPAGLVAQTASMAQGDADDDNRDATRVASVSQELLQASALAGTVDPMAAPRRASPLPAVQSVAPVGGGEDQHFQDVFREFLATRERCGEPAEGLTFDKFAVKLRKNKEQLVAKYNCRTVRFQVYVKEGKAALKATPVKE